jgi:hypothetical protein
MATREIVQLADGTKRYKYKIRRKLADGRTVTRVKQFRTDTAGERWARRLEVEIDAGKNVPALETEQRSFGDLARRYRTEMLPGYDARVTRQANGRPHRIGQTEPVRLLYPYYSGTLQKTALDLVARKITAALQVDGLSLAGALEAAGARRRRPQVRHGELDAPF